MVYLLPHGIDTFPDGLHPNRHGLVALGGELNAELVASAYQRGVFPWTGELPIPWCSPDPRLILRPGELHVSRSLRKVGARGDYEVHFDRNFRAVMRGCAAIPRAGQDGTWITANMHQVYGELHERGITHSVETYRNGQLVGGLYGLSFGRVFFGESMFALAANASKVALRALCERLAAWDFELIDCQQVTPHLVSLGARAIPRVEYLGWLQGALQHPSRHGSWASSARND